MCSRADSFGRGNSIFRSKRPDRRRAGSRISIRFVAAMTLAFRQLFSFFHSSPHKRQKGTHLDSTIARETIQLVQQLQHCPLHFPITTLIAVKPLCSDSIQLVDEDDSRRLLFGKFESVADEFRTITEIHLDKSGTGKFEVASVGLSGTGSGEKGFTRTRGTVHEASFRRCNAKSFEFVCLLHG